MGRLVTSFRCVSFEYDFATQGSPIGQVGQGVFLPASALIIGTRINPIQNLAAGGVSSLNLGLLGGTTTDILDHPIQGLSGSFSDYNQATFGFGLGVSNGNPFGSFIPPDRIKQFNAPGEVAIDTQGQVLTAGRFTATIMFLSF